MLCSFFGAATAILVRSGPNDVLTGTMTPPALMRPKTSPVSAPLQCRSDSLSAPSSASNIFDYVTIVNQRDAFMRRLVRVVVVVGVRLMRSSDVECRYGSGTMLLTTTRDTRNLCSAVWWDRHGSAADVCGAAKNS